ncbi:MAG: ACT domain-containing protein [Clostridia bacterium]|nr:ACT domain-containing protein [Clostridia bacterium]
MAINQIITDISVTYSVALVTVDNLPKKLSLIADIFKTIAAQEVNVDMISVSPPYRDTVNISFSIPSDDLVKAISALNQHKKDVPALNIEVDADNTKLSVYGEGMKNSHGVAARLFTILAAEDIEVKLVTTSEVDISYLVYEKDIDKAIEAIRREFQVK